MKQTRADNWLALAQSLLLHAVLLGLLFIGLRWSGNAAPDAATGAPIEAELIDASDLSPALQRALRRAPAAPRPAPVQPPEPLPQPLAEEPAPPLPRELPPPVPDPAPVAQARVQRDAALPALPDQRREQEERRRQPPQVELDAQRESEMERQRQQQIAELRRERERIARQRSIAEQRVRQLADARDGATEPARSQPAPGAGGSDPGLLARYRDALQRAIVRQWTRPDSVALGQLCQITIRQLPGGDVISVEIDPSCPYDAQGRRSVEAAVLKAAPLPYAGFESVFNRTLILNFEAADR